MERLKNPREFGLVYSRGTPCFGRYVVVSYLPTQRDVSRVGYAVSKKVGNAVTRNKIKRRLKAIIQNQTNQFSPGYDVVIGAKRSAVGASFAELEQDVRRTLNKSRLLTGAARSSGDEHA